MWPKPRISSGSAASSTAVAWFSGDSACGDLVEQRLVFGDEAALGAALGGAAEEVERACRAGSAAAASRRKAASIQGP